MMIRIPRAIPARECADGYLVITVPVDSGEGRIGLGVHTG